MTAAQRLREQGRQEGRQEGQQEARAEGLQRSRDLLLRLMQLRFGSQLDPDDERRLRTATLEQVEAWSLRVITAASPVELFTD
ncbi:MAG: hypothetical protein R3B48_26075 [Kofleriaceae bacterium]